MARLGFFSTFYALTGNWTCVSSVPSLWGTLIQDAFTDWVAAAGGKGAFNGQLSISTSCSLSKLVSVRNGFCPSNRSGQKWSGFEFRHSAGVVAETSERRASRQLRRRPLGSRRHRLGGRHELKGWVRSPEWGHLFANGRLQMKCVAFMRCDSMALFWLFRFLFKLEPTGFPPIGPTLVKQMARKFICPISLKNAKKLWSNFCSSQQWVVFIFVTRASDSLYCDWPLNDVIF